MLLGAGCSPSLSWALRHSSLALAAPLVACGTVLVLLACCNLRLPLLLQGTTWLPRPHLGLEEALPGAPRPRA